jgi:protein gp37
MADKSKIEWTDATWNIITGCSVVSPACTNCYAMRLAGTRLRSHPSRAGLTTDSKAGPVWTGDVRFNEEWLLQPLQWKRPRRIFVAAHGDLFHKGVKDEWLDKIFAVMQSARRHTFQILTKRPERMREYISQLSTIADGANQEWFSRGFVWPVASKEAREEWPFKNVWLGTTAEDQERADERIPHLLATPAAVRFVSIEPMLGDIELGPSGALGRVKIRTPRKAPANVEPARGDELLLDVIKRMGGTVEEIPGVDWVICGGESGPNARPMHPDWARSLRDQCAAAGVSFHFKQWGEWAPQAGAVDGWTIDDNPEISRFDHRDWEGDHYGEPYRPMWDQERDDDTVSRIGKKRAGRLLDGVEHNGFPEIRP